MANIRHNLKNLLLKGKSFVSVINSSKENILNGNLDKRGWQSVSGGGPVVPSYDPDAQAFITAANITDSTQKTAINTLVTDFKTYSIWSKMKAVYPMVGGSASSHSYNLKNPAQYQITWNGGLTHSSNGVLGNGTNGYGNTNLSPNTNLVKYNTHTSIYLRTNTDGIYCDLGASNDSFNEMVTIYSKNSGNATSDMGNYAISRISVATSDSLGNYINSRTANNAFKLYKNSTTLGTNTSTDTNNLPLKNLTIFGINYGASPSQFSNRQCAFATIGDGLSDTEAANLYTSIQKFQTTLGRYVGTPIVSDPDAQAFLNSASITDLTQANAVNTLVTDLKGANLWTKMKALYPMVGGTASTHKFNLKDPRDLDAAFRLVFNGGMTHSNTGILFGGVNGYADSKLNLFNNYGSSYNNHFSVYYRTNNINWEKIGANSGSYYLGMSTHICYSDDNTYNDNMGRNSVSNTTYGNSAASHISSLLSTTSQKMYRNGVLKISGNAFSGYSFPSQNFYFGALCEAGTAVYFSNREVAFGSIGDGLTDAESSTLYTIIQNYQISLGRSVGPQTVSDPDAQLFINTANIEDQIQATAVNYLVTDLKSNNLWTKMKAVYPIVGGNATSHSYNLKNPSQFQITFNGGWTHASTGATPNGTNAYANTYLSPNSQLSLNNASISYYSRTSGFSTSIMGASNTLNDAILLAPRFAVGILDDYSAINCSTVQKSAAPNTLGLFTISRIASTNYKGYQNGTQYFNSITSSSALTTQNIYIGARNWNGSADQYGNLQCAFASIGDGLTDTDASNLNTIIQNYQTILSRQV